MNGLSGIYNTPPVDCVLVLGVLLDSSLRMHQHITRVTSTCFLSPKAPQGQPLAHTKQGNPEATCVRSGVNSCRYCSSGLAGLSDSTVHTSAVTTSTRCGGAVCPRPAVMRSCHGRTAVTPLAAGAPAHHVHVVRIDAPCSFWIRADIST